MMTALSRHSELPGPISFSNWVARPESAKGVVTDQIGEKTTPIPEPLGVPPTTQIETMIGRGQLLAECRHAAAQEAMLNGIATSGRKSVPPCVYF